MDFADFASTGGIVALGLGVKGWRVSKCRDFFKELSKQAFSERPMKHLALISHKSYYKTRPLEDALKSAFDSTSLLYGGPNHDATGIRVAVTSTSANENYPVILSNYNTGSERGHCKFMPELLNSETHLLSSALPLCEAP